VPGSAGQPGKPVEAFVSTNTIDSLWYGSPSVHAAPSEEQPTPAASVIPLRMAPQMSNVRAPRRTKFATWTAEGKRVAPSKVVRGLADSRAKNVSILKVCAAISPNANGTGGDPSTPEPMHSNLGWRTGSGGGAAIRTVRC